MSSNRTIQVFGFDCGLFQSHFCALNRRLNNNRFTFTFAAIAEKSGQIVSLASNSDTHIAKFHKKNVPYEYHVTTLFLDDFSKTNKIMPTHLKIDEDGAGDGVLRGAQNILASNALREIFIEVDRKNDEIIDFVCSFSSFKISWKIEKKIESGYPVYQIKFLIIRLKLPFWAYLPASCENLQLACLRAGQLFGKRCNSQKYGQGTKAENIEQIIKSVMKVNKGN